MIVLVVVIFDVPMYNNNITLSHALSTSLFASTHKYACNYYYYII